MIVGILRGDNNTARIVIPADGFTVQDNFDRIGEQGFEMHAAELPQNRIFRDAWMINQTETGITINLEKAKLLAIKKLENITNKQLKAIRPSWEEAVDNDDTVLMDQIKADRKDIRTTLISKISGINACTTIAEIEAYLP